MVTEFAKVFPHVTQFSHLRYQVHTAILHSYTIIIVIRVIILIARSATAVKILDLF